MIFGEEIEPAKKLEPKKVKVKVMRGLFDVASSLSFFEFMFHSTWHALSGRGNGSQVVG